MLVPPNRELYQNHPDKVLFHLLLSKIGPILTQSIHQFGGFIPFGMGCVKERIIPFQWPINKLLPTFGLIEWVTEEIKNSDETLDAAALAFAVNVKTSMIEEHSVIVLDTPHGDPIKLFVPFDQSRKEDWWCEPAQKKLL